MPFRRPVFVSVWDAENSFLLCLTCYVKAGTDLYYRGTACIDSIHAVRAPARIRNLAFSNSLQSSGQLLLEHRALMRAIPASRQCHIFSDAAIRRSENESQNTLTEPMCSLVFEIRTYKQVARLGRKLRAYKKLGHKRRSIRLPSSRVPCS